MRFLGAGVVLAAMLGAAAAQMGRPDPSPVELTVEVEQTQEDVPLGNAEALSNPKAPGEAVKATSHFLTYAAKLHNKGMDDLSNVGVKIYVIGLGATTPEDHPPFPGAPPAPRPGPVIALLSVDHIAIPSGQDATVALGKMAYDIAYSTPSSTFYNQGSVYKGYVSEVYIDGQRVDVRTYNPMFKGLYEAFLQAQPNAQPFQPTFQAIQVVTHGHSLMNTPAANATPSGSLGPGATPTPAPSPSVPLSPSGTRPVRTAPPVVLPLVSPARGSADPVPNLPAEVSLGFAVGMGPLPLPPRPDDASPSDAPIQAVGETVSFDLRVRNLGASDLSNTAVKIFAITHGFGGPPGVGAVLGAGPLAVAANGTTPASLGPAITFIMPMAGMRPAGGSYLGYVLEFYLDGNLVGVAASNPMARQFYDASVQDHPDRPLYPGLAVPWVAKGAVRPGGLAP